MTTQTPRTAPPRSTPRVVDSDTEGVPSFEASGGDWSEIASRAASFVQSLN